MKSAYERREDAPLLECSGEPRLSDGREVQRQVLYLGEINDSQREAWRKTIEVLDEGSRRQVALFPEGSMPGDDAQVVGIRLNELQLKH